MAQRNRPGPTIGRLDRYQPNPAPVTTTNTTSNSTRIPSAISNSLRTAAPTRSSSTVSTATNSIKSSVMSVASTRVAARNLHSTVAQTRRLTKDLTATTNRLSTNTTSTMAATNLATTSRAPPPKFKGLAKFANPIECQRIFTNLNNRVDDLEKELALKERIMEKRSVQTRHVVDVGLGYAITVQKFAQKLRLGSDRDLETECAELNKLVEQLKLNESQFDTKLKEIKSDHEDRLQKELKARKDLSEELRQEKSRFWSETEDLKLKHRDEVCVMTHEYGSTIGALEEQLRVAKSDLKDRNIELVDLKKEYENLITQYDKLQQSLINDKDARVKMACERADQLKKDVDSLNTVLELKTQQIHSLERENARLQDVTNELIKTEGENKTLKQQLESAQAVLENKRQEIEELNSLIDDINRKLKQENNERRRMTMRTEELKYALDESTNINDTSTSSNGSNNDTSNTNVDSHNDSTNNILPTSSVNQNITNNNNNNNINNNNNDTSFNKIDTELKLIPLNTLKNFKSVESDLIASKNIGLTLIDENKERIIVICLTTKQAIYVICPDARDQIEFLKLQLQRRDINFYTINGFWDSDLLSSQLDIILDGQLDLIALDIQLTILDYTHRKKTIKDSLSMDFIVKTIRPVMNDYNQLLEKWLVADVNTTCSPDELNAIKDNPIGTVAESAIKRKASLVRALGLRMAQEYHTIRDKPSKDIYSMAIRADDDTRMAYDNKMDNSFDELSNTLNNCPVIQESVGQQEN